MRPFPSTLQSPSLSRSLLLGCLAGLVTSSGFIGFALLQVVYNSFGYDAELGGGYRLYDWRGLWGGRYAPSTYSAALPMYLLLLNVVLSPFFGIILAKVVPGRRRSD